MELLFFLITNIYNNHIYSLIIINKIKNKEWKLSNLNHKLKLLILNKSNPTISISIVQIFNKINNSLITNTINCKKINTSKLIILNKIKFNCKIL